MNSIQTKNIPITPEMEEHFLSYLSKHTQLVASYARILCDGKFITEKLYQHIRNTHDISKLDEPEYTPYVKRNWIEYKAGGASLYDNMGEDVKDAIVHHVTNNDHHPEFWSYDYRGFKSKDPCHINMMPERCVIEMVCDWSAMGLQHGNSARSWYDKCRNKRWIFTSETEDLINKWLTVFEDIFVI